MLFALCLVMVGGAIFAYATRDRRTPQQRAVEGAIEAVSKRDADALFALISEEEKQASGITRENLRRYLNDYVLAGLGTLEPSGEIQPSEIVVTGSFSATRHFRTATGSIPIHFSSDTVGDHTRVSSAVWSLLIARMNSELSGASVPQGRGRMLFIIDTLKRDKAAVEAVGIKGVLFMNDDGDRFFTWSEYIINRERALARYEERMKADKR
ncbi:MAG: hypothetical protein M3R13_07800 [Armatimonadota bacterium]|nr:hypothetical protein [Armatimonadota bacterium]